MQLVLSANGGTLVSAGWRFRFKTQSLQVSPKLISQRAALPTRQMSAL